MGRLRTVVCFLFCFAQLGGVLTGELSAAPIIQLDGAPANPLTSEPIYPIPFEAGVDENKAALGGRLFHDSILSSDGSLSCASCHNLKNGGHDGLPLSLPYSGATGAIHTRTDFNSALSFRRDWH